MSLESLRPPVTVAPNSPHQPRTRQTGKFAHANLIAGEWSAACVHQA